MYNYCGPYWSAGKFQTSVESDVPHVNALDRACRDHDAAYARNQNLRAADLAFSREAAKHGIAGRAMGLIVGAQALLRSKDNSTTNNNNNYFHKPATTTMPNLRKPNKSKTNGRVSNTTRAGNDVVTAAPAAVATRRTGQAAAIRQRKNGITVSNRVFLSSVDNTSAYAATSYSCNPAMASTFPWLGRMAARYDKYRFTQLRFEYRSVTSTSKPGVIMLSFDYDALDDVPISKFEQSQTIPNAENNVWMNNDLQVKLDSEWRFTRQGTIADTDLKTYDLGNLIVSSQYGDGVIGGELYVTYTVELDKPTDPAPLSMRANYTAGGLTTPFTTLVSTSGNARPGHVQSTTDFEFDVPGTFRVTAIYDGTGITAITPPTTTGVILGRHEVITATKAMTTYQIRVTKGDYLTIPGVTATTFTTYNMWIGEESRTVNP